MRDKTHLASDSLSPIATIEKSQLHSSKVSDNSYPKHPLEISDLSLKKVFSGESQTAVYSTAVSQPPVSGNLSSMGEDTVLHTASSSSRGNPLSLVQHTGIDGTYQTFLYSISILDPYSYVQFLLSL
jgi:hypothetical protein